MTQDLPPVIASLDASPSPGSVWTYAGDKDVRQTYRGTFSGNRDDLKGIRALVETAATQSALNEVVAAAFEMAVDEICANIIEHNYENHGTGSLVIEVGLYPDRIECVVTDQAAIRFDVTQAPQLGIDAFHEQGRKRGLGLEIVRHCVDEVHHQWLDQHGNQIRLVKCYGSGL